VKLSEIELQKIFSTLEDIGFDLYHWSLSWMDIDKAIREFQEHIGGDLQIPLINGLGHKIDVTGINIALLKDCVNILAARHKKKENRTDETKLPDFGTRGPGNVLP
jgi:3-dehydroquinate synthase